jgi:hypothetical protein
LSVDTVANSITISAGNPWGAPKKSTFTLTSSTTITADGATVSLANLTAGALVCIQTSSSAATTPTSITVVDPRVGGTVTAVDTTGDTITITDPTGATKTFSFTSSTMVSEDGSAGTIADITAGAHVQLVLSALGGTVLGIQSDSVPDGNPPENPEPPVGPGGKVVAIDATADTITLQNGVGIQTVYTANSATTVTLDGAASQFSAIVVGDFAQLQLSSDGTTVTGIEANDQVKPSAGGTGDTGGGQTNPAPPVQLFGSIISVDSAGDKVTFQVAGSGASTAYALGSGAEITVDGAVSALSAVVAGDNAHLVLSADGTSIVRLDASDKINPSAPPAQSGPSGNGGDPASAGPKGLVLSVDIDAATITLQSNEGAQTTYTLSSSASVMLDGTSSSLAAVVGGDHAQLTLDTAGTSVIVVQATDQAPPPGGPGGPSGPGGPQGNPGAGQ